MCPHCGFRADFEEIARQEKAKRDQLHDTRSAEDIAAEMEAARIQKQIAAIPIVTLQYMPGRTVRSVIGIVTSEVVLGTGFMTEASTKIADFLGTRGTMFEEKWRTAKEAALSDLKRTAFELGCNAVLAADVELSTVGDIPMLIVTGTGVVLEDSTDEVGQVLHHS